MAARQGLTPGLPQPNTIDDLHRLLQLGVQAEEAAKRGHDLLAKGEAAGARKALEEAEACMKEREVIRARWKPPPWTGGVEDSAQAPTAGRSKSRGRR